MVGDEGVSTLIGVLRYGNLGLSTEGTMQPASCVKVPRVRVA